MTDTEILETYGDEIATVLAECKINSQEDVVSLLEMFLRLKQSELDLILRFIQNKNYSDSELFDLIKTAKEIGATESELELFSFNQESEVDAARAVAAVNELYEINEKLEKQNKQINQQNKIIITTVCTLLLLIVYVLYRHKQPLTE